MENTENKDTGIIRDDTPIEENIVFSERHEAFFKARLGEDFMLTDDLRDWLGNNAGKSYGDAVIACWKLVKAKKGPSETEKKFEYNAYIRDFIKDNRGKSLEQARTCWNYKKSLEGPNRYERSDLAALDKDKNSGE